MSTGEGAGNWPANAWMMTRLRLGALAWIATLQFFVVEACAGRAWPGYDFVADRISDLGTMRSPHHALVNASLLLQGALIAGGAYLLRDAFPPGRLRALGLWLVALNGLGVLLVGLVPEDVNRALPDVGAALLFFAGNVGLLALGLALLREASRRWTVGAAAVALSTLGIVGSLLYGIRAVSAHAIGAFEHLAVDPLPLWLFIAGLVSVGIERRRLLRNRVRRDASHTTANCQRGIGRD